MGRSEVGYSFIDCSAAAGGREGSAQWARIASNWACNNIIGPPIYIGQAIVAKGRPRIAPANWTPVNLPTCSLTAPKLLWNGEKRAFEWTRMKLLRENALKVLGKCSENAVLNFSWNRSETAPKLP